MKNRYLEKIAGFQRSPGSIMHRLAQLNTADKHRLLKWLSGSPGKKPLILQPAKDKKKNVRTS